MEQLSLISRQEPGVAVIDNFEELKDALQFHLEAYKNLVYTQNGAADAKKDKAALTKLKKAIDEKRKEIKKVYMQPYTIVEAQTKELIALIDEPLALIAEYLAQEEAAEKEIRRSEIATYFHQHSTPLGELADSILANPAFYESKWENKSTTTKAYQAAISAKIAAVSADISTIQASGGRYTAPLLERYFQTFSMDGLTEYKASLEAAELAADTTVSAIPTDDNVIGYKVLRLTGTAQQLTQILEQMELLGIDVDELEDGMPQEMTELHAPTFDSFVTFDIETTGTYGAAHGDASPEITEIGAVKVVNGEIVARFSELANPGRKIVPRIARLTHITDDMLADKPPVSEVIQKFKEFVGDSALVGHNIKNCDIPYISKAAKRAGIAFDNPYFDTYRYAKTMKAEMGWENVKLEYLSQQFGISQPDAHRAWCDAEANVGVYLRLKELGGA